VIRRAIQVAVGAAVVVAIAGPLPPAGAGHLECDGKEATITQPNQYGQYVGTPGDDVIVASDLSNTIDGRAGRDTICALGGEDTIFGFDGGDTVFAGRAGDALYGEDGRDELRGQDGADFFAGGSGRDRCLGGPGVDTGGSSCEERRSIP
jgi:Ca2+-binding RTX toxin-like protein